jgi:hypothetical protein
VLRHLGRLKNAGMLIGFIWRFSESDNKKAVPFANQNVIAKSVRNGGEYTTHTNEKGLFEFDLPGGTYDVTIPPEYGLCEDEDFPFSMPGSVPVENGRCWEHDFAVKPITAIKPKTGEDISGHLSRRMARRKPSQPGVTTPNP